MGKKSKIKQKNNENIIKPLISELFQRCVNPTGTSAPSPKELFSAFKETAEMLENVEKQRGESFLSKLPKREHCIEEFYKWAKGCDISSENVEIKCVRSGELGVFAVNEIAKGDMFISIPRKAMLTTDTIKKSKISSLVDSDPMLSSMPNVALALHLLCEAYNEKSIWRPYINILPRHYTNILYFEIDDIENLKGTSVFLQAINTYNSIVRQYAYLSNLFYKHPLAKELGLTSKFTFDDYRWAVATLMTRQNPIPALDGSVTPIIALIPFLDLCNHKEGPVSIDYNPENQQCECFAMDSAPAGNEVLIHYGPRPNPELVIYNGFFYNNNSHDFMKLKLSLSKSDPLYEARQKQVAKLGLEKDFPLGCLPSPFKDSLKAFLAISSASEEELTQMQELDAAELATKLQSPGFISSETEIKSLKMLKDRCDLCWKLIPCKENNFDALQENEKISGTRKLSLLLRMNERSLLENALSYIDKKIDLLQSPLH